MIPDPGIAQECTPAARRLPPGSAPRRGGSRRRGRRAAGTRRCPGVPARTPRRRCRPAPGAPPPPLRPGAPRPRTPSARPPSSGNWGPLLHPTTVTCADARGNPARTAGAGPEPHRHRRRTLTARGIGGGVVEVAVDVEDVQVVPDRTPERLGGTHHDAAVAADQQGRHVPGLTQGSAPGAHRRGPRRCGAPASCGSAGWRDEAGSSGRATSPSSTAAPAGRAQTREELGIAVRVARRSRCPGYGGAGPERNAPG